jgi:Tfp pilus assembly protein PilE
MIYNTSMRGFTLLIAVIFTSVILAVGLALTDISYKEVTLASSSKQSQYAFYNADSALECALYWDSIDTFDYTGEPTGSYPSVPSGTLSCQKQTINYYGGIASGNSRTTTFSIPCAGSGTDADITIFKQSNGATSIYANGYNTCNTSDPQRVQRGEEAHY